MAQSQGKSQMTNSVHARRLNDWNKRMSKFYQNTAKLDEFIKTSSPIVKLEKCIEEHGFEADCSPEDGNMVNDSVTNGNTFYCKLLKFKYFPPGSRKNNELAVLGRQYHFFPGMTDRMMQAIGEGARLQAYFSSSRMKEAPFFLDIYGVFYDSPPQDGPKLLYVMHDMLPPSSLAHKLWNFNAPPRRAAEWTLEVARAAEWLNLAGVAHRFIRPENVLLTDDKHIRLAGFDVACSFFKIKSYSKGGGQPQGEYIQQDMGLPEEIPRQLWDHLPPECFAKHYDPCMVDSWSIGVLLCTLLTASHPFDVEQHLTLPQQWRQSAERAVVPLMAKDDPLRTLLDDIFQPMDQRMTTFDMIRDQRLHSPAKPSSSPKARSVQYYRIDKNLKKPPPNSSSISVQPAPLDASKFSDKSLEMFNQTAEFIGVKSEADLQLRKHGTKYQLLRNESFGGQFDIFHSERFLATASINEQGQPQGSYLAKIFLVQHISSSYRNILLAESSKIIRYLGTANGLVPTLLRVGDIFSTKQKMYIIYSNELIGSKSLCQLTAEGALKNLQLLDHVMQQLAVTVNNLTLHGLAHRYLRPEHVFVTPNGIIKVTNLEMLCFTWNPKAREQLFRTKGLHDNNEQNWDHLPPECFLERYDSQLLDVWSFGVCLAYCITEQVPFTVPHTMEEAFSAWNRYRDEHKSSLASYLDLLKRIFQPSDRRIRSDELVEVFQRKLTTRNNQSNYSSRSSHIPSSHI